jgi:hypothetical protein
LITLRHQLQDRPGVGICDGRGVGEAQKVQHRHVRKDRSVLAKVLEENDTLIEFVDLLFLLKAAVSPTTENGVC